MLVFGRIFDRGFLREGKERNGGGWRVGEEGFEMMGRFFFLWGDLLVGIFYLFVGGLFVGFCLFCFWFRFFCCCCFMLWLGLCIDLFICVFCCNFNMFYYCCYIMFLLF
uniref:Putative C-rich region 4 n=1 Tax=Trypanosoma lewisi TaxID=5695 RepID=A0A7G4WFF1_TRYLE|nr:putative C-rich region 4 [Trypanosoma lewisi]